ncbi:PepSY domain-containing protein [Hansschlegelia sp. KR7-227]|uniref:PepSY domain-containing protein n=1 Tax=Hansschlegelia sp. KR7-227 TaxID=3400914 RepID=UPI003C0195EB
MRAVRLGLTVCLALAATAPSARGDSEQDEARRAVEGGEIRSLDQVLKVARARVPGDVVKVELERDGGRWTYEIKILTESGERREVEIDASTLAVLEVD